MNATIQGVPPRDSRRSRHRGRARVLLTLLVLGCLAGSMFGSLVGIGGCSPAVSPAPSLLEEIEGVPARRQQVVELSLPASEHPLLVAVESAGANLDTQLLGAGGQLLSRVHFDYLRSVPAFHVADPAEAGPGARLRIVAMQAPAGATLNVTYYTLADTAGAGQPLYEAWRSLAAGQARIETLDESAWAVNLAALESARDRFDRLGHRVPALWAGYLRAYLLYFPLYRYADAADATGALLEAIGGRDAAPDDDPAWRTIEVLAHQLAGQIRLESGPGTGGRSAEPPLVEARRHFTMARDLAHEAGLAFEATWAINNLGIAYFYGDQLDSALEHYAIALREAEQSADPNLVALIASNVAVAQERSGDINSAVATLERIGREPAIRDSALEHELLLSLLGNYYLKLYRFPDALEALNEALALSDALASAEARGRNRVMLARAYREMGQPQKARLLVEQAVPDLQAVQDRRGLRQARRLLADLDRREGRFASLQAARAQEHALLDTDRDRAEWLFSTAEDAAARGDGAAAAAAYRASAEAFAATGLADWADLATLNACVAQPPNPPESGCSITALEGRYEGLHTLQASAPALRARFAWARLLAAQGEPAAARLRAAELVDEIQYYRQTLPGVLGAWYWDARHDIFTFYLQQVLDSPAPAGNGRADVLLALDRLRNSGPPSRPKVIPETPAGPDDPQAFPETATLRSLLAQRDRAVTPEAHLRAQRLIDRELARHKQAIDIAPPPDPTEFLAQLAAMPPDWSLVAWYLAGPTALAWVATDTGLQQFELGPAGPILDAADRVRSKLRVFNEPTLDDDLAVLGEALLGPLQPALRFNVMTASGEALADLPLDALLLDGRPLIESHQVLHVESVAHAVATAQRARSTLEPRRLFLAGSPQVDATGLDALPGTQAELAAAHAAFPHAETALYEQAALNPSAVRGPAFHSADLVHLASHAVIDRDYPELSRLVVSGESEGGQAFLTPADLAGSSLAARLVVLSACETVGLNRFDFDNRLGFVSTLLQQADTLVVASLWPVSDRVTGRLMAAFYEELAATGDVPRALRTAKLQQRDDRDARGWAAFQLFSR